VTVDRRRHDCGALPCVVGVADHRGTGAEVVTTGGDDRDPVRPEPFAVGLGESRM